MVLPVYLKDDFLVYKKPGTMVLPATVVKGLGFWVRLDGPNDVNGWYKLSLKGFDGLFGRCSLLLRLLRS